MTLDALVGGRPLLIAEHAAIDGRATVLRERPDSPSGQLVESLVITTDGVVESATPVLTQVTHVAVAGDSEALTIAYVPVGSDGELRVAEVVTETGALSGPALRFVHTRPLLDVAVARAGTTSMTAFVSATSDDPADGQSLFLYRVVAGLPDAVVQHELPAEVQGLAISEAPGGWLIAHASGEVVSTLLVDETGAEVESQRVSPAEFVSDVVLVARDEGFLMAYDGATPMLESLDSSGDSSGETLAGHFIALDASGDAFTMSLRSEATTCSAAGAPLSFERFGSELNALHEAVRVGAGDAALTLIDGSPWVVSSGHGMLSLTSACVDGDDD